MLTFTIFFREMGIRCIYAFTEECNIISRHLCEWPGMRREGRFTEFVSFIKNPDGSPFYKKTMEYALLKRIWMAGGAV